MANFLLVEGFTQRSLRRQRIFRDRLNALDNLDDVDLMRRYRLPRSLIIDLIEELEPMIESPTNRSRAVPASIQVLCALRFYAGGAFQKDTGDLHGISQSSVSKFINKVSAALCARANKHIVFPSNVIDIRRQMMAFHAIDAFPNVLGCIDGTQIAIMTPSTNEKIYVCRKGYHSINVQVVCGANMEFLNVVARWPGSTHDSFIWNDSQVSTVLNDRYENGQSGWLLGDSGYPLRPFLLTPILKERDNADNKYNICHKRTRCLVERAIGQLKIRFRCLDKTGGCLVMSPQRSAQIIIACSVLHNTGFK